MNHTISWLIKFYSVINYFLVNAHSLSNNRGDLDGEKVIKAASKADCVLALNGESCMSQYHEKNQRLYFAILLTPLRFIQLRTNDSI